MKRKKKRITKEEVRLVQKKIEQEVKEINEKKERLYSFDEIIAKFNLKKKL